MLHRMIQLQFMLLLVAGGGPASADKFTFTDLDGQSRTVEARLAGTGRGAVALELDDGEWKIVSDGVLTTREPGEDPIPLNSQQMADRLAERFSPERFEYRIADPYVVGLVLAAPLDEPARAQLRKFFGKATSFVQSIDRVFTRFAEEMGLDPQPNRFPLVMLIFETNEDFNRYAQEATGGEGLSAENISGFYSGATNWLAIRLDECDSFAVPLHEAIHQQTFNRGILQRFAPIPTWFGEGIATGFENDGARVDVDPRRLNRSYATRAMREFTVKFPDIIQSDDAFHGDVLAGDAYVLAWCLHWLLVTQHPQEYTAYVRKLGSLEPLAESNEDQRLEEFREAFGIDPEKLPEIISRELTVAARRQRLKLEPPAPPVGKLVTQDSMGVLELGLVRRGGAVQGVGNLKNLSPFRSLMFRVRVIGPDNRGIQWIVPELAPNRTTRLDNKLMPAAGQGYRVEIDSAIPGTPTAADLGGGR
jgi:Protein of unknown function (DUF1570)